MASRRKESSQIGRRAVFQRARRSMVWFAAPYKKGTLRLAGSGFAVGGSLIVTAAHILNPADSQAPVPTHAIVLEPLEPLGRARARVPHSVIPLKNAVSATHPSKAIDLALIKVNHSFSSDRTLRTATTGPYVGQRVGTFGWPSVVDLLMKRIVPIPSALEGVIGNILPHPSARTEVQVVYLAQLPVYGGNSGGPVFDPQTGKVFGVVSGRLPVPVQTKPRDPPESTHVIPEEVRIGLTRVTPITHLSSIKSKLEA